MIYHIIYQSLIYKFLLEKKYIYKSGNGYHVYSDKINKGILQEKVSMYSTQVRVTKRGIPVPASACRKWINDNKNNPDLFKKKRNDFMLNFV